MTRSPRQPVAAGAAFLASIASALAQTPTIERADITQYGVYLGRVTETRKSSGTPTGTIDGVVWQFISETTVVPASRGVRFGFEYRLVGTPPGASLPIHSVTLFPAEGLRNARTGRAYDHSEYVYEAKIGEPILMGYSLDETWEVVPGLWVLQIWNGEQKLAEMKFTLE